MNGYGFVLRCIGASAFAIGRMVFLLAVAGLLCTSVAYGQVVGEGGFPVKGGSVSGESFSLICPSRLAVQAGSSIALSCSATAVPEEGVRYEWEAVSGDGFHLLSASDELSPLFTAPLSGESAEYVYRLTAMSVGVYETATLTVVVGGVWGETAGTPVVREDCDPFTVPEGFGESCAEDKGPAPFGFGPESEGGFLFPEAPGLPDRPSGPVRGGGFDRQAPPRLECPVAVFLEELETGAIECHAWDASGEEYLEYSWEPVGSTTRDYLDNPRLLPEDAPNPSVVAPEAPRYDTLESFRSGETTFRYRYRLTATSRATGLSSWQEVEVYVSSSRPSVYCPLEVVVEEGSTVALDCDGVDPLSFRMDYDEDGASIEWEWEGLWGTSTGLLDATDRSSPLFTAPPGSAGEEYHYIASMTSQASGVPRTARRRVTVRVAGGEEGGRNAVNVTEEVAADASSLLQGNLILTITCDPGYSNTAEAPWHHAFTGQDKFSFDCAVSGLPDGATLTIAWTSSTEGGMALLQNTNTLDPEFQVPATVTGAVTYDYTLTVSDGSSEASIDIEVVVNRSSTAVLYCVLWYDILAGSTDFDIHCKIPAGGPRGVTHQFRWSGSDAAMARLSDRTIRTPTFDVPGPNEIDGDRTYEYTLRWCTFGCENNDFLVIVRDPAIACTDPDPVYEAAADITLDCSAENAPSDATYSWTGTDVDDRLSNTNGLTPTFAPPDNVDSDTDYAYRVTMTSGGSVVASDDITVMVLNKPDIVVACAGNPYEVNEDEADFDLDCTASGAPAGSVYTWSWSPIDRLADHDSGTPTFDVPDDGVEQDTTWTYTVTAMADNAEGGGASVTVTVKDTPPSAIACTDPEPVYEDSGPLTLSCTEENKPPGATYAWTGTDVDNRLTDTDGLTPTFTPPDNVDADTDYDYTVTMMSGGSEVASADVTVTVLNTPPSIACTATPDRVYEGSADDITVSCSAQNTPSVPFIYAWGGSDDFVNLLKGWNGDWPIFGAPDNVNGDTEYVFTVNIYIGQNGCQPDLPSCALDSVAETDVTVTVLEKPDIAVTCPGNPYAVDEGDGLALDCSASGAPDVNSQYTWSWSPVDRLTNHDTGAPVFSAPADVDQDTTWTYRVTATADNADDAAAEVTVTVLDRYSTVPSLTCNDSEVYEATADFTLSCSVTDEPTGATYAWTGTDIANRLSSMTILNPAFDVPDNVDAHTDYDYTVTLSASGIVDVTEDVTVRVLNKPSLALVCTPPAPVYEGAADFDLDCSASGAPAGSVYTYAWTARGDTPDLSLLSNTSSPAPTFSVPSSVNGHETYEYRLTVSADNAEDAVADVRVTVLNKGALSVVCADPGSAYEGSAAFDLDCVASGAPAGSVYAYAWTARGDTPDTALLSNTSGPAPTFAVPSNVDADETYEYRLTASADNAEDATADVRVRVLDRGALAVACASPPLVYEGSSDFDLDCAASGAPAGSVYTYAWTARGDTPDTALLSNTNGPAPTFSVPSSVNGNETYEYTLTVSAANAEDAVADVTVTVLNKKALSVVCADPGSVYEGSAAISFNCAASGAPAGSAYAYAWTARGDTPDLSLLSNTNGPAPTFSVPSSVNGNEAYEYRLTVSADNAEDAVADVTVTVLNKGALAVVCTDPAAVYEGEEDVALDCAASGAPASSVYTYVWTARGDTPDTALLSNVDIASPTFYVPDEVDKTTIYEYTLTVSAESVESATAAVAVTVLNRGALAVVCTDPGSVYEGEDDFALDCAASGAPAGSVYTYAWTARGDTPDTALLNATNISSPVFSVPDEVDEDETYQYLLTVSADNAEDATAEVTVTVLNRGALAVVCTDPGSVYEGEEDVALDCAASGAPAGSVYTYAWTARGDTPDTALLNATDISSPVFSVPDEVDEDETYQYLLTVSADNAEDATAEVTVTVLNKGALAVVCADPGSVYEGSEDIAFDCSASGAPGDNPQYTYVWTARGDTPDLSLLSNTNGPAPTFSVPSSVNGNETYEYRLTVSADNAEDATAEVTVTVLNKEALIAVCADPVSVYEGSADIAFDCTASGAPAGSNYTYAWTARGNTLDTSLLSATDVASPTFHVPDEVEEDETYEYRLTVSTSAENIDPGTFDLTVNVYNSNDLEVVCTDRTVYEGSPPFRLQCTASGGPPGVLREWDWSPATHLTGPRIRTPTFTVPDNVERDMTFTYTATVTAGSMVATGEVTVTVLDRASLAFADDSISDRVYVFTVGETIADILLPEATGGLSPYTYTLTPALPEGLDLDDPTRTISGTPLEVSPRTEYTWQASDANNETVHIAFFIQVVSAVDTTSPPVAESTPPPAESSSVAFVEPTALGVTVSASPLRFGVQSAETEVSLDPVTDGISTQISGPYHAGRMTLSPGGGAAFDENGEMDLSIELVSPVVLRREGGIEGASLVLSPVWSFAESCEQLSSQSIGSLYTEVTLSEEDCRLLRFGGDLDLIGALPGLYSGRMDIVLRSGEREETHSVEVEVTVVPAQRVITIGPGGVRFSTSRELPAGLTEEQNLSIYPDVAFLTKEKPNGAFELSNPSLIPLEVTVSARFGYTEEAENGREVVVEDSEGSPLADLSQVVDIYPGVVVLMPGEKGLVRYGVQEGALAAMSEKGYAAFFDVVSSPRQYVRSDRMPEEVSGDRTARVTMRIPGVYVPGEGASQLRATLLSISFVGSLSATFLLETQDRPFAGEVVAYDGDGRELGRRETLVYTRSRVRVPLDRMPDEEAVFLRFVPRGSSRVPGPVNIPWNAPFSTELPFSP